MNCCSSPSELKITDLRVANINHVPKHCILLKIETNRGATGYGEVPDAPGLGIGELDEELIAELAHEKFKAPWASTDEWNGEWANDRTWS